MRLIDADTFLKDVLPECKYPDALREAVERQPTIEADPVRNGRWEEIGGYEPENQGFACSVCDFATTVKSRFCPNCGARMDGGAENDT